MYMLMHSHSYCKLPTETFLLFLLLALQSMVNISLFQNCPSGFQIQKLLNRTFFLWGGDVSPTHSPNLEVQGIPCYLGHLFYLSSMGGPASSYSTASIGLWIIWPHKPQHYRKLSNNQRPNFAPGYDGWHFQYRFSISCIFGIYELVIASGKVLRTGNNCNGRNNFGRQV